MTSVRRRDALSHFDAIGPPRLSRQERGASETAVFRPHHAREKSQASVAPTGSPPPSRRCDRPDRSCRDDPHPPNGAPTPINSGRGHTCAPAQHGRSSPAKRRNADRRSGMTVVRSCTIITRPANELVAPLHDRVPVILAPEAHARSTGNASSHVEGQGRSRLRAFPSCVAGDHFVAGPRSVLVHRSRQKIHPSLAAHGMLPRFQPFPGAGTVNRLNASVH